MTHRDGKSFERRAKLAWTALLVLFGTLIATGSHAMYARLSDQELLDRSDLIVTGVVIGQTRIRSGSLDLMVGVIQIQETLKGGNAQVALLAFPAPGQPISSSDVQHPVGASGLWYLRLRSESELGIYVADHPQRFVAAADAQEALKVLRQRRNGTPK